MAFTKAPVSFQANRGQSAPEVQFLSQGGGYSLFLTPREFVVSLPSSRAGEGVLRFQPLGANPEPEMAGVGPVAASTNYLMGEDRSKWVTGAPSFGAVRYGSLYPGIDLVFHGGNGQLEYDFEVAPATDPGAIALAVHGADRMAVDAEGALVIDTAAGQVRQPKPVIYQVVDGRRRTVKGGYVTSGVSRVGFRVGEYDARKTLVIDPVLPFSTHLGGEGDDGGHAIATDAKGNSYVTGWTASPNFPREGSEKGFADVVTTRESPGLNIGCRATGRGGKLAGGGRTVFSLEQPISGGGGCGDAFVTKLSPEGTVLYSTYLGGTGREAGVGIAVDSSGSAYVAGFTSSRNFPTQGAFQPALAGHSTADAFVAKLDPSGAGLQYSTYLGGQTVDGATGIALDSSSKVYVGGFTSSADFPTRAPFQAALAGGSFADAFVAKLDPAATGPASLVYSTFLGGALVEAANGIAVDSAGSAYVTGAAGEGFPTKNAVQPRHRGCRVPAETGLCPDAFVAKLNPAGSALTYATYLGGAGEDVGMGIAVDADKNAHVTGSAGAGLTTKNAAQEKLSGDTDAFVAKLNPSGSALLYSTYLGGTGTDRGSAIAVGSDGRAHVVGTMAPSSSTTPVEFPLVDPIQAGKPGGGETDAFVATIDPGKSGSDSLGLSTPFGGRGADDSGNGIAVGKGGTLHVTGATQSSWDFPTTKAVQPAGNGDTDAFVTKVSSLPPGMPVVSSVSPRSGPPAGGSHVVLTGSGFRDVKAVQFGSSTATEYKVSADGRRMAVRVPPHDAGEVEVSVSTDKGEAAPAPFARFVYAPGAWSKTGAPSLARSWPAAVRLKGGKVLLAGGCVARQTKNDACVRATAAAEIYDPGSGKWSRTGDMTIARHAGIATALLPDGKVLAVGGSGPRGETLGTAEVYDPGSGRWTATAPRVGAAAPADARDVASGGAQGNRVFTATVLGTGKVLVVGNESAELYDPATGAWAATGNRPLPLPYDHTATLLPDGKVVVVGENATDVYDPASATWLPSSHSVVARLSKTTSLLPNGHLLVVGGRISDFSAVVTAEFYDPGAPSPRPPGARGAWRGARSLAVARQGHAAATLADGRVLIVGGTHGEGGRLDVAEMYDPANEQRGPAGAMVHGEGRGVTATTLENGKVLVVGGGGSSAQLYDPNPAPNRAPLAVPAGAGADGGQPWALVGSVGLGLAALVAVVAAIKRVRSRRRPSAYPFPWP